MTYAEKCSKFAEYINESKHTVFFGGAGVSTESSMKDYRSENGLYNTVNDFGYSPETILSRSFLEKHPDIFYKFFSEYFFCDVLPNDAHKTLAKLEASKKLQAVITQNIDMLHQRAGSKNIIELHGNMSRYHCHKCNMQNDKARDTAARGEIPYCKNCGGVCRPDIILYEEALDSSVIDKAINEISQAELLIIGGTSLCVYPAAGFLRYFRGKHIVLINKSATNYDSSADIVFSESIGKVLKDVYEKI
ncbi:MAG: NAD-dependent protein deacylase [Clostridia bacterium]|nr:NAD-dependent protein deacylase [Clostridia bacterium]